MQNVDKRVLWSLSSVKALLSSFVQLAYQKGNEDGDDLFTMNGPTIGFQG